MSSDDEENLPLTLPFAECKLSGDSDSADDSAVEKYKSTWGYLYPVDISYQFQRK